jgi:hypothetical protein
MKHPKHPIIQTGPLWFLDAAHAHAEGDAACGRSWDTNGCQCSACVFARREGISANGLHQLKAVDEGFKRLDALQRHYATVRAVKREAKR